MNFDLEELAAIIEQLDKTEFTDFRFEQGSLSIQVRRGGYYSDGSANPVPQTTTTASTGSPNVQSAADQVPDSQGSSEAPATPATVSSPGAIDASNLPEGHIAVTAPMLGTFYGAPKPGEPAFVKVGDTVDADSVLCIVEVMKLMNSVTAGTAGEVSAIFVKDGDLVEFAQPLFAIQALA